jgi:hypothetical protein
MRGMLFFCVLTPLVLTAGIGEAALPRTLSYQGVLRDASGNPVPDWAYEITFTLYDAPTAGSVLWQEVNTAQVTDGIVDMILGEYEPLDLPFDQTYWLGIKVGSDPELSPRVELASAPYALRAAVADVGSDGDWVINGNDIHHLVGRVGIGTDTPTETLDVVGNRIRLRESEDPQADAIMLRTDGDAVDLQAENADLHIRSGSGGTHGNTILQGFGGNVGVGTETPGERLEVAGAVKMTGFSMATGATAGFVLTSDASGVGTWQASTEEFTLPYVGSVVSDNFALWIDNTGSGVAIVGTSPNTGVRGISSASAGAGVSGAGVDSDGVYGETSGGGGVYGVHGYAGEYSVGDGVLGESVAGHGVVGKSHASEGRGVLGEHSDGNKGVLGTQYYGARGTHQNGNWGAAGTKNYGVRGENTSGHWGALGAADYGVYGKQSDDCTWNCFAGWFDGTVWVTDDLYVDGSTSLDWTEIADDLFVHDNADIWDNAHVGGHLEVDLTITKGGGGFKIDHPLDPTNKNLLHSFVESPDMKNIYDGVATLDGSGEAWVHLPEWFEALNRDFRYQLTCIGRFAPVYVADKISNSSFRIAGGEPGMEVCWMVTGIRRDAFAEAYRIPVEEMKPPDKQGLYLHPEAFGLGEEMSIGHQQLPDTE